MVGAVCPQSFTESLAIRLCFSPKPQLSNKRYYGQSEKCIRYFTLSQHTMQLLSVTKALLSALQELVPFVCYTAGLMLMCCAVPQMGLHFFCQGPN